MRRRCPRDQRGASAVEFALVVPLLLMLLFGLITTGFVFSDHLAATNAVREGTRYGAAADITSADWATSVRDRVKQVYFNDAGADPADGEICVKVVKAGGGDAATAWDPGTCGTAPTPPTNMVAGSCAVLVWMQREETIQLLVVPDLELNIGAESVAYYGREVAPCIAP